jgi:hypothetical protein
MRHGGDEEDGGPGRRRWPIVRSLFVLLLVLIIGGGYLGWRYTQDQYYVAADGGRVAVFQGVNQSVAGVSLSHVYQRTSIPLAGVPSPYQGQIRATVSATSRSSALAIVANIRKQYDNCLAAYAAQARYTSALNAYQSARSAYKKKWHDLKPHKLKDGKLVKPPTFAQAQPLTPPGCPGPSATNGTGAGGSA